VKVRFLVNPSAGKGKTRKRWRRMFEGKGLDVRLCAEPGRLGREAGQAVRDGVTRLVVVGGDGSLNAAVNAIRGSRMELAVIPTGSGNDFARMFQIPLLPPERYIEPCNLRRVDLGRVGERLFVNIFGSGFDAEVAKGMQESSLKGDLGYLAAVLRTLMNFRSPRVLVRTDRERLTARTMTVSVGNGRYHGGMFMLTPFAELDDAELDLCLVRRISKSRFLALIPSSLKGRHVEHTDVVSMHRFRRMELHFSRPVYYHVDGEVSPRPLERIEISVLPKALAFVVP